MDKALFVGMSGQSNSLRELEMLSNNLANVNTPGYRADYETVKQNHLPNKDSGMETRVYSSIGSSYSDHKQGPILRTGRDFDVAISGEGMFSVQSKTGREGYTRAGNFDVNGEGFLTTASGQLVLGTRGAIHIPPSEMLEIAKDGTVTIKPIGEKETVTIGQLKLVRPKPHEVEKGEDGLFYSTTGGLLEADNTVKASSGALEGSNVNPVETLIKLIDLSRQYEMHSNFIKNISEQSIQSNKLLDLKV